LSKIRKLPAKNLWRNTTKARNAIYKGGERILIMKLKIKDKIVDVDTSSGVPTIKAKAEEIHRPDGGVDVVIHVPCLKIAGNMKKG